MKCSVRFKLNEVNCPGTLHLSNRNPVFVVVCLFGRFQRTQHVYPSFPMVFNAKIKFQRVFTNAKTPEHVLEILQDEDILIELRQHRKGRKGGIVLAAFEENARKFLYPSPSFIPKEDHFKRDVLLDRTEHFPAGKGLAPQLTFRTKTCIEEFPVLTVATPYSISKKIPQSLCVDYQYPKTAVKKKKRKSLSLERKYLNRSAPVQYTGEESDSSSDNDSLEDVPPSYLDNVGKQSHKEQSKHCICECPVIYGKDFNMAVWLDEISSGQQENDKMTPKPFRTGKAPDELLSARKFNKPEKKKKKSNRFAFCKRCLVPSRNCVLCNAYKTVYGADTFLHHRFQRFHKFCPPVDLTGRMKRMNVTEEFSIQNDDSFLRSSSGNSRRKSRSLSTIFQTSKRPEVARSSFDYVKSHDIDVDGDDSVADSDSDADRKERQYSYQRCSVSYAKPKKTSVISYSSSDDIAKDDGISHLSVFGKRYGRNNIGAANIDKSYRDETDRIHRRIKSLMKKNDSVLQYDLSSSDSITDESEAGDEDNTYFEMSRPRLESTRSTSERKPAQSLVVPLGSGKLWSSTRSENTEYATSRDKFDSSLKSVYRDLYEKTSSRL